MGVRNFDLVQIMTHSACSARCIICPYKDSWQAKNPGYMSDEDYEHVLQEIDKVDDRKRFKFCPYLQNEPLLDKNIIKRIELAYSYFPNMRLEVSTNATHLTKQLSQQLVDTYLEFDKTGVAEIWISHHAINKETFEQVMQLKNYDKVVDNIINFLKYNEGRVRVVFRGLGSYKIGDYKLFTPRQYSRYITNLLESNDISMKNIEIDNGTFHSRAGSVTRFGHDFYRQIDKNHRFYCPRFDKALHVVYDLDVIPCFPPGTKILSRNGLVNIEDVKVGEKVYSHDGKLHKVTETYMRDVSENIYRITLRKYKLQDIIATHNHPFLTRNKRNGNIEWKEAKQLTKDDMIYIPKIKERGKINSITLLKYLREKDIVVINGNIFRIHKQYKNILNTSKVPHYLKLNDDIMWLFGMYLAEGHVDKDEEITFSLNKNEMNIVNKILNTLENNDIGFRYHITRYRENNLDLKITNKNLAHLLKTFFGNMCDEKFIHKSILKYTSNKMLLNIVNGFLEGDGCNDDNRNRFRLITTSKTLALQLYLILKNNNKLANIYHYVKKKKKDTYEISVNTSESGMRHRIHLENKDGYWLPIKEVKTEFYTGKVYNLEVEDANSYLVDGLFSAHNCCMDYNKKYVFGNLKKESLEDIIKGEAWTTFIKMGTGEIESPDDFICKLCESPGG